MNSFLSKLKTLLIDEKASPSLIALVPLRLFLGFTFIFAGLQKIANPSFFDSRNPISIQNQMAAYSKHSPIGSLLSPISHYAVLFGIIIAVSEVAVGIGVLFGFLTRIAAIGGMTISFMFFLSVSFHSSPYYTGSDIVFVFGFITIVLSGPGRLNSIDALMGKIRDEKLKTLKSRQREGAANPLRRSLLKSFAALLGGLGILSIGFDAVLGRLFSTPAKIASFKSLGLSQGGLNQITPQTSNTTIGATTNPSASNPTSTAGNSGSTPTSSTSNAPAPSTTQQLPKPPGTPIGAGSQVPINQVASFTDPYTSNAAYVYHPSANQFEAFDATCPHAGCTVQPVVSQKIFECPCHGSQFDISTGQVLQGPAVSNLTQIAIALGGDGQLYVAS